MDSDSQGDMVNEAAEEAQASAEEPEGVIEDDGPGAGALHVEPPPEHELLPQPYDVDEAQEEHDEEEPVRQGTPHAPPDTAPHHSQNPGGWPTASHGAALLPLPPLLPPMMPWLLARLYEGNMDTMSRARTTRRSSSAARR